MWEKPIYLVRSSHADFFDATEMVVPSKGKLFLEFTDSDGNITKQLVNSFDNSGIAVSFYNSAAHMTEFAQVSFEFALTKEVPLYFTTKNTILKTYDGLFKKIFQEMYEKRYKEAFKKKNIWYEHRLIDDMVATMVKSDGGYVWAAKNYDGEVESAAVAGGFGGRSLMTKTLLSGGNIIISSRVEETEGLLGRLIAWALAIKIMGNKEKNNSLRLIGDGIEDALETLLNEGLVAFSDASLVKNPISNKVTSENEGRRVY